MMLHVTNNVAGKDSTALDRRDITLYNDVVL